MSIMVGKRAGQWTLTEAARLLEEPKHRLIYLCEKQVVLPDVQDAVGRGSSRRFSPRNLLEFAVALRLREADIPAATVALVIHVLRAFEASVRKTAPGFHLPESLRVAKAPDFRAVISDGDKLYFTLRKGASTPKIYGGLDLSALSPSKAKSSAVERELARANRPSRRIPPSEFGHPEGSKHTRVEISITRIACDLTI
jgi:hypothetical protein